MANHLSRDQQIQVIHLLVEGNSLRSITRLTGIQRTTVMNLLVRVGARCRDFLDREMRDLELDHIQCDEIWTFVRKKQRRLTVAEQRDPTIGDQYLFVAIDKDTKLIPSFAIGKRTKETTEMFADDLASRLRQPDPFAKETFQQISTDGWASYVDAIDEAFSGCAEHGVLIKNYAQAEQPGRYAPPEIEGTQRRVVSGQITPRSICTSHVERNNLTIRTFMKRFTRLSLGFSKKLENLLAAVCLHITFHNYCRIHGTLGKTPAMAAGIIGHPMALAELLDEIGF